MPLKLPAVDETAMNMTPMIDITFNLVVFFMLTLDISQKEFVEVDLPVATQGVPDKEDPLAEVPRFAINLTADGRVQFKGNTYNISSTNAVEQDQALEDLRNALGALTNKPEWREPDGASKVSVMVHGDRSAKWQYVQWIMQVCANPRIKIYKIQFAIKHPPTEEQG
jgi:biopolymer transport protein ExbD